MSKRPRRPCNSVLGENKRPVKDPDLLQERRAERTRLPRPRASCLLAVALNHPQAVLSLGSAVHTADLAPGQRRRTPAAPTTSSRHWQAPRPRSV